MYNSRKSNSKGKRPSAGAKGSNVVMFPFRVSIFERSLFNLLLIFGVIIPRILNLVFHDFKTLKSLIVKSRKAFKKNGSALHHFLVYLRARITVKNADVMNLEKAFCIAFMIRKLKKAGIKVNRRQYLILAGLPTVTQIIIAVLNEPDAYKEKGTWALGIINACSGNPLIVIAPLTILAYKTDLAAFNEAQGDMASGAHTAREIRNKAWIQVKNDLLAMRKVQNLTAEK